MPPRLEVGFTRGHVFFPAGHLSRIGGTFDGMLAASAIRDVGPAAAPPEIRTLSGETLFVSAVQRAELERFCQVSRIPVRERPDIWGDLLEPFVDTEFTPEFEAVTRSRLCQAGLTDSEISQIRARVGPLMLAYNAYYWDWCHLGLADLLDALTTESLPGYLYAGLRVEEIRAGLGETTSFYAWAMRIANCGEPRPGGNASESPVPLPSANASYGNWAVAATTLTTLARDSPWPAVAVTSHPWCGLGSTANSVP